MPMGVYKRESLDSRFWKRVIKTEDCWLWTAGTVQGYGLLHEKGKHVNAHRYSYEFHNGKIPNGLCVLHRCDNRRCVNPKHLFLGTREENQADMKAKGRAASGERNGMSKLFAGEVDQIRELRGELSAREIARLFNISQDYVYELWRGKKWIKK